MGRINISHFEKDLLTYSHVGLDSMCFIYLFENNPSFSPLAETLLNLMGKKKISGVTSTVTLVETFVLPERMNNQLLIVEYEKIFAHLPNLELVSIDWRVSRLAAKLRAAYKTLRTPDAIQVAATLLRGYPAFVTNDEKLQKIKELKILLLKDYL